MADIRFALPAVVTLPVAETISHQHLRIALGDASRALLNLWRKERGFPKSYRDGASSFCITADVESWLHKNGVSVRRI